MVPKILFQRIIFITVLSGILASACAQDKIKLRMVPMVEAPVIEKNNFKLTIDFVFNRCPQEYWIFYNRESGRLIIEFFGIHTDAPPITIKGTTVVKDLSIFNSETNMSLTGKNSQISMELQQGWHYSSKITPDGKTLRLLLWMPLNPSKRLQARRNQYVLPVVLTLFGVAGVTSLIVLAATDTAPFGSK